MDVSHYRIEEEIGRGPLGAVHKAQDTVEKKTVAMRVLPASAPRLQGLAADLKAAAAVAHPALVHVVALSDLDGQRAVRRARRSVGRRNLAGAPRELLT